MSERHLRLGAVVLAAGAGSRFSVHKEVKLLAELQGRPVLQHVLTAVQAADLAATIVVLGHSADEVEETVAWNGEIRVRNYHPERGLASSIKVGIGALGSLPDDFDGAFVVLGDQPRLRASVMAELSRRASAECPADRPFIVPRYPETESLRGDSGPRNPVLVLRPAWLFIDQLSGDRGLASLIDDRSDQVLEVSVPGVMPDVDTRADLEALS